MLFDLAGLFYSMIFYFGIVIVIIILIMWFILLYKNSQKRGIIRYLLVAAIIGIIGQIITALPNNLYLLTFLFTGIAFFLIFLHYESLFDLKPNQYILGISIGFQVLVLFLYIAQYIGLLDFELDRQLIRFLFNLGSSIMLIRSLYVVSRINKMTHKSDVKIEYIGILLLLISRIIYTIVGLSFIIGFYYINSGFDWIITTIPDDLNALHMGSVLVVLILTSIGLFLLLANFIVNFDYIFRLPFPIQNIILYNNAGLTVYTREVLTPELKYDENLVSGALTAI